MTSDVVEQGESEGRAPSRWLRGGALLAVAALGVLVVTRGDLLSADRPLADSASPAAKTPADDLGGGVVVRDGDHLERYDLGSRRRLATLPSALPGRARLVHAPRLDGTGPLVGVNQTVLFRASATRGRTVTAVGRAERVIAASRSPFGVYVLQPVAGAPDGHRVIELDARTGEIIDDRPFPGFAGAVGWEPTDVITVGAGLSGLLLTRDAGGGRLQLALAWDRLGVGPQDEPGLSRIGVARQVLGAADGRLVTSADAGDCQGANCRLSVVTITRDGFRSRTVEPPPGWVFGAGFAVGDRGDPVVGVAQGDDPGRRALARLVAGGRRALLVPGSLGAVASVPPVGGPDGSVIFAVSGRGAGPEQREEVRIALWRPDEPRRSTLVGPPLPPGAELVCQCR